jgi:hypothetical protein
MISTTYGLIAIAVIGLFAALMVEAFLRVIRLRRDADLAGDLAELNFGLADELNGVRAELCALELEREAIDTRRRFVEQDRRMLRAELAQRNSNVEDLSAAARNLKRNDGEWKIGETDEQWQRDYSPQPIE